MRNYEVDVFDTWYRFVKTIKLPKQFHHWMKKAGIVRKSRLKGRKGYRIKDHLWTGHGRHWRINCRGIFECSERFTTFDRWANSNPQVGVEAETLDNERLALAVVRTMLKEATQIELNQYTE